MDVAIYLRDQLLGLGEKRPDRGTLRQRVSQALKDLPDHLRPKRKRADDGGDNHNMENGV